MNTVSSRMEDLLKEKLDQLQCHFTWSPQKETIDLDDMVYRLQDAIIFADKYQAASYNQLAFVNCLQGNSEEAIQNLQEAEKILRENHKDAFERNSIITYGNYAWVHYHMGQLAKAQSYLDKLEMICKPLTDGPRYTAMIPEVYGEKGWSLLSSAAVYYEEAMECFEKALEEDPNNTEWIMGKATVLFRLESFSGTPESHEWIQSVKYLRRVLELDPDDSMAMVMLANKLQGFSRREANELVEQALQKSSNDPYVLRYSAKFYRVEGAVDTAIILFKQALELTPHSCFMHHQIGMCYKIKLDKLGDRNPHSPATQQQTELISQCKYHFGKASECRPRTAIRPMLDLAQVYIINGEYSKAEEIYNNLVKLEDIRPENVQQICLQAGSYELYEKGSESSAISLFLKGVKIEYNSKERKKCKEKLEKWADKKLRYAPHDSRALSVRGLMYKMDGNKSKAIEYFEKALKIDHENEEYLSALSELRLSD
ncbi:interferon-induced protein with tetratricopeptide repeats 1-like [Amblyraja radiata]|uniref:interferon-induced protein with tetratricopeptide repeats 1-like n=1 Tax=Amblyraja radiata TaxID=386614 RepID=UPI001402DD65|nr:interferon-induced protein with tetratricopeptide repeats 1-like [Amblyraja radiata]